MTKFIVIEGSDFSGKSTQVDLLVERLRAEDKTVAQFKEPGGTEVGEVIRELFARDDLNHYSRYLLMEASRCELSIHIAALMVSKKYDYIICDRWRMSTDIYQGIVQGIDLELMQVVKTYVPTITPVMTIVLDVDDSDILKRSGSRKDDTDYAQSLTDSLMTISEAYRQLAVAPKHVLIAPGSLNAMHENVYKQLMEL